MSHAIYPGTFDPITLGHADVIRRAAQHFDRLTVVVMTNPKKNTLFTTSERVQLVQDAVTDIGGVEVESWEGLLVEGARTRGIGAVVKGLRSSGDFEYEMSMAQMNYHLAKVDTFFVAASPQFSYVSSSLIKEVASHGGSVREFVTDTVFTAVMKRIEDRRS